MEKELLTALKEGNLYDFIANNYWQMTKEQLKDVILELDYSYYHQDSYNDNLEDIADELKDRWNMNEEA